MYPCQGEVWFEVVLGKLDPTVEITTNTELSVFNLSCTLEASKHIDL